MTFDKYTKVGAVALLFTSFFVAHTDKFFPTDHTHTKSSAKIHRRAEIIFKSPHRAAALLHTYTQVAPNFCAVLLSRVRAASKRTTRVCIGDEPARLRNRTGIFAQSCLPSFLSPGACNYTSQQQESALFASGPEVWRNK